jgi:hypothetical protein
MCHRARVVVLSAGFPQAYQLQSPRKKPNSALSREISQRIVTKFLQNSS